MPTDDLPEEKENVIAKLWETFQSHAPIRLINTFRGVPVEADAKIALISQGYLAVNAPGQQITCIALEKRTYIQCERLNHIYRAMPVAVDIHNDGLILTRFTQVGADFGKRMELRVQPREPLRIRIFHGMTSSIASIADLSLNGLGVLMFGAYTLEQVDIKRAQSVKVELHLPGSPLPLLLQAKVMNINQLADNTTQRLGLRIQPSEQDRVTISSYINIRKEEIMAELQALYQQMKLEPQA